MENTKVEEIKKVEEKTKDEDKRDLKLFKDKNGNVYKYEFSEEEEEEDEDKRDLKLFKDKNGNVYTYEFSYLEKLEKEGEDEEEPKSNFYILIESVFDGLTFVGVLSVFKDLLNKYF